MTAQPQKCPRCGTPLAPQGTVLFVCEDPEMRKHLPPGLAGLSPEEAIYEACLARFRPILMTTMAALLGAIPLAIAVGPGSEIRRPLGITIIGGLIVSQMLTLYTTPVIYLLLDRLHRRLGGAPRQADAIDAAPAPAPH